MNPFAQQTPIPGVKHIIAVGSGKGGVGKSTVAANLSLALKEQGLKVGLLDADIYGPSLPRLMGALGAQPEVDESKKIHPVVRHGLKLMSIGFMVDENHAIIWRGPMLFKAMDQFFRDVAWGELDALVVDLPPGTGDVALTLAQKVPVSGGVVVCTPQNLALMDAKRAVDMFEKVNIRCLGVVENMAYMMNPANGEKIQLFPQGDLHAYLDARQLKALGQIPFHPNIGLTSEAGIPVVISQPQSAEAQAFKALAQSVWAAISSSN